MNNLPPCSPSLAAKQTRVLLGCYRKGEASDPEVYVTSVATVLARYPETVVRKVTHPVDGIPGRIHWLPTVAEVRSACEAEMKPFYDFAARQRKAQESAALLAGPAATTEQRERAVAHWDGMRPLGAPEGPKGEPETPEQAFARLEALKDKPVVVGGELAKKIEAMKGGNP